MERKAIGTGGPRSGFTFVEVLLAVLITGLVMTSLYGILVSTLQVKDLMEGALDEEKAGSLAFDLVRRDVQAACALRDGTLFFKTGRGRAGASRSRGASELNFLAATRNRFPDASVFKARGSEKEEVADIRCDLVEIGYRVETSSDESVLVRREDFYVDDDLEKGGVSMKICRRVKSFSLLFYRGDEAATREDPVDEWDAEEEEALPFAVKIRLVLDRSVEDGDEREKVFEAVVPLLAGERAVEEEGR